MLTGASGQVPVTQEMVQRAKAMGASDAQINAAMHATSPSSSQSSPASTSADTGGNEVRREVSADQQQTSGDKTADQRRSADFLTRNTVFGQEIFSTKNLTFAPSYNMATPPNYVLGPGDEVIIEVWGEAESRVQEKISPEGSISIQGVGPINLAGLTVAEAQKRVESRIHEIMNGQVKVSLGQIRSIKVNISGEVVTPGTYTLPSLATLFNAIYSAGGVNGIGSLRHIQVFRNSKQIADLDVYDYLINGKYETNIRLEDNDMIIVPPYDNHVTIGGKIKRERIYDMKDGETLARLIDFGGGFTGDAYSDNVTVHRKSGRMLTILTVDKADFGTFELLDGDSVSIGKVLPMYANMVAIEGAVWRPGEYEFSEKIATLSQLIAKAEGLKGSEFASRGQITRVDMANNYTVIPFDVREVVGGQTDIALQNLDRVYIPNIYDLREEYTVTVKGEVNNPHTFTFRKGMTVEDVVLICGGLRESASLAKIEVARRIKDPQLTSYSPKIAENYSFEISEDLKIAPEDSRFLIEPFDEIYIRRSPGYSEQQSVAITGEILFGGEYVLASAGERLSDIIKKAGGFTPEAYVVGASVQRRLTADDRAKVAAVMAIANTNKGKDSVSTQSVEIPDYYPVGIDVMAAVKNPGSNDDIILQDGASALEVVSIAETLMPQLLKIQMAALEFRL